MNYSPGAGQEPPAKLGSFMNEEGRRRSARIAAMAEKTAMDFSSKEAAAVLAILKGTAAGGRRRRLVGGDGELDELIAFLGPKVGETLEYVKSKLADPANMAMRVGAVGLNTVDSVVDAASVTVVLATSAVGGTVGTVGAVIRNYVRFAKKSAEWLMDATRQQTVADKASEKITLTLAATLLAANTAGILPLTTILAGAFYGAGILTTDASRAAIISGFYQWYLTIDEADQEDVLEQAKEYAKAAAAGAAGVAGAATAVANSIANANKKAGEMNKPQLPAAASAVITPAALEKGAEKAVDPVVTGAIATQILATAADDSVKGAKALAAAEAVGTAEERAAKKAEGEAAIAAIVPPPGNRAPTTREKAAAAVAAAKAAKAAAAPVAAAPAAAPVAAAPAAAPAAPKPVIRTSSRIMTRRATALSGMPSAAAEAASDTTGGRRRKTRSKKTKRRVTRRKARMPVFAY